MKKGRPGISEAKIREIFRLNANDTPLGEIAEAVGCHRQTVRTYLRTNPLGRETYTIEEAARILGISRDSVLKMANEGRLPSIRVSARVLLVPKGRLRQMLYGDKEVKP